MNYLADTQILVWALEENSKFSEKARRILLDKEYCRNAGYVPLTTKFVYATQIETLKYAKEEAPRDHHDPFDRLLLAIAKTEGFGFLTHDSLIPYYHESCVVSV